MRSCILQYFKLKFVLFLAIFLFRTSAFCLFVSLLPVRFPFAVSWQTIGRILAKASEVLQVRIAAFSGKLIKSYVIILRFKF